jgi:hypothetical protein
MEVFCVIIRFLATLAPWSVVAWVAYLMRDRFNNDQYFVLLLFAACIGGAVRATMYIWEDTEAGRRVADAVAAAKLRAFRHSDDDVE